MVTTKERAEGLYMWFKLYTQETKKIPDYGRYDFFMAMIGMGVRLDPEHSKFVYEYRQAHHSLLE